MCTATVPARCHHPGLTGMWNTDWNGGADQLVVRQLFPRRTSETRRPWGLPDSVRWLELRHMWSISRRLNAGPRLRISREFGLGLNHDAEHARGFVLRHPERLHGVLDREPVGDQSAGEFRAGSQQVGRLDEVRAGVVAAVAERGTQSYFLNEGGIHRPGRSGVV